MLLGSKVDEARRMRVFEPNDVGLVRLPRSAWVLVMGTEAKTTALRSRLYVEKYRVRVLIETVCYVGLKGLIFRTTQQDDELRSLRKMLPLIAERLVGVQKDYVPRLTGRKIEAEVEAQRIEEVKTEQQKPIASAPENETPVMPEKEFSKPSISRNLSMRSMSTNSLASTCSSSSSTTIYEDSIQEIWLLRHNQPKCKTKHSISFFGIKWYTSHTIEPASYYVKPVSSCLSEIKDIRIQCQGHSSEADYQTSLRKAILKMDDDAQWEIQRLLEARETASSSDSVRRDWDVVAFMERPRRYISASSVPQEKKWYRRTSKLAKKELVEWVLVLKGETVDRRSRALPSKNEDPWNPRSQAAKKAAPTMPVPSHAPVKQQQQQQVGTVLRHVENRRAMSAEEAETKMNEILRQLFVCDKGNEGNFEKEEGMDSRSAMGRGL